MDKGTPPSVANRIGIIAYEAFYTTSTPTKSHQDAYAIAAEEFKPLLEQLKKVVGEDLKKLQEKLQAAGAPYTPYSLPSFSID